MVKLYHIISTVHPNWDVTDVSFPVTATCPLPFGMLLRRNCRF